MTSTVMTIPGLVVPPLTPFTAELTVDYDALKHGVDYVVKDCDAAMVIAAGVEAQEYQYLDLPQRRELIRRTIEFVDGRRPVVVGVSHPSFKVSIDLAHFAEELGASAVQLLAPLRPFGGEPSPRDLERYVDAVAGETSLPLMLYLNAGAGATVSPEATIALASRDSIRFVKESSRDLSRVSRLIEEIDQAGLAHYFTTVQMMLISLQLGGSGVTLPPPVAKIASLILQSFLKGDVAEAVRLQRQFSLYPTKWMRYGLTPTMKASLNLLGVPAGAPYPPYSPVTGEDLDDLRAFLATTDLEIVEEL
ncbi:dihydrodipicolinate synthase family protein [Micromonospora sp. NPDC005206]|uniref:dihydrodipicolinate synthase family protein n=1 Tax=Micromonospora sp. NPDC005206 TaxID=3157022 RepID=UPI0033A52697